MEKLLNNELFEFQKDLLTKEIQFIHSKIAAYDDLSFKIKGWAVTIWSAVVALGIKERDPFIVFASLPALTAFWILDAYFKQYQRRSMTRMGVIEMFLDSRSYFEDSGIRTAFEKKDFGQFPIHDPIASRTKNLKGKYLFNWDEIPGNDDKRLINYLSDDLEIEWVKTENICKIDDDKTIIVSNKEKSISLKLNDEKTKVNLKIDDVKVDEYTVKTENGKLNIYNEIFKKWYRDHTSLQRSFLVPNVRNFYLILNLGAIAILLLLIMFAI